MSMAQTGHRLWGRDSAGVWHVAVATFTYNNNMDTRCGQHVKAVVFASSRDPYVKRDKLCEQCREPKGEA